MKKLLILLLTAGINVNAYVKRVQSVGSFDKERNSYPVMVTYFAPRARKQVAARVPLAQMDNRFAQLSNQYASDFLRFVQINNDSALAKLANRYKVAQQPAFLIFQKGAPSARLYGELGYEQLEDFVEKKAEKLAVTECERQAGKQRIKTKDDPWYSTYPQIWAAYGNYFAGPMNRKYYANPNAFPPPGYWIGAQW